MNNSIIQNNENVSPTFKIPLWYLQLKTRIIKYNNLFFLDLILSTIPAGILTSILMIFIENFTSLAIGILFIIFWFIFFYIFWRKFTKDVRLDNFEKFAYYNEAIGLDLEKLSVDENLYVDSSIMISSLYSSSRNVARTFPKLKKRSTEKTTRGLLLEFSEKIYNLYKLFKKPEDHKVELVNLSKEFILLANSVNTTNEIDNTILVSLNKALNDILIPRPIDRINNFISSLLSIIDPSKKIGKIILIIFDVGLFFFVFYGSMKFLGATNNYALGASMLLCTSSLILILSRK